MPRDWSKVSVYAGSRGIAEATRAAEIDMAVAPTFTRSFVTGSRAYGTPRPDSDIDLVVLVDEVAFALLQTMTKDIGTNNNYDPEDARCFRFGDLNLLCCKNPKHFAVWKAGTEELVKRSREVGPVCREEAKAFLAELRIRNGIKVY